MTASLPGRYATALYELAREQGAVTVVESDLAVFAQVLVDSTDLASLIRNPQITRDEQSKAMDAVITVLGSSQLTRNFIGVLIANRRLAVLLDIIHAFAAIVAAARGEVTAHVTSAHALSKAQLAALSDKLKAREGCDVRIDACLDPDLLGGMVIRIGSQQIDSSIRTRLNSLAQTMKG